MRARYALDIDIDEYQFLDGYGSPIISVTDLIEARKAYANTQLEGLDLICRKVVLDDMVPVDLEIPAITIKVP